MEEIFKSEKNESYLYAKCKYCGNTIKGSSKGQIEALLLIHKIFKHRDKIEIKEKD